jgi:methylenetetrahydrofolate dehydrogenase (NADP+)/methenyltetrahydrofolate cyclohydrolase
MHLIDGKAISQRIQQDVKEQVAQLLEPPGLAIILIGDDPGSHTYVGLKEKACQAAGIHFEKYLFPITVNQEAILQLIGRLNTRADIHGILIQFPVPLHLDANRLVAAIDPRKDVDGFHPKNIEALKQGKPIITPGLAAGIVLCIESTGVPLTGKKAIICANSPTFAEPLHYLLSQRGASVVIEYAETGATPQATTQADIVIAAVGKPNFLTAAMVKSGAIIIDVGYNRLGAKVVGDVDFASVSRKASYITPVPGGIGPITVAMLLKNVVHAAIIQGQT